MMPADFHLPGAPEELTTSSSSATIRNTAISLEKVYDDIIRLFFSAEAEGRDPVSLVNALSNHLSFLRVEKGEEAANMVVARLKLHILNPEYRQKALPELCAFVESQESPQKSVADVMRYFWYRVPDAMSSTEPLDMHKEIVDEAEKDRIIDECLATLPCACFDDEIQLLALFKWQLKKAKCRGSIETYDTGRLIGQENRFDAQFEIIGRSKLIISDCNDAWQWAFGVDKRLREGLKDPEKVFIVVSGVPENKELVDNEFKAEYGHRYVYLSKPYDFSELEKAIRYLVWSNICNKKTTYPK